MGELADTGKEAGIEPGAGGGAAVESVKGGMGSAAAREVAMREHRIAEGAEGPEPLAEILAVMGLEELIRFRHRLGKKGRERMVQLLTLEIARREE
jgi:hypothetical protein